MLDKEIAQFITDFNSLGIDYTKMTPQAARALSHELSSKRPLMKDLPEMNIETCTITKRAIKVRIYRPKRYTSEILPAIFYFHGGGFIWGLPEHYDEFCSVLADCAGAVIISVDYRYAPEFPFPAGLNDCYDVVSYVAKNPEKFNIDPQHISVAGDSAGGNFAAAVCLRARDESKLKLRAQLLIYPCLDVDMNTPSNREMSEGYILTTEAMKWFYQLYLPNLGDQNNPLAMPLKANDLSHLPPALIIVAKYDPLFDDGKKYFDRLQAADVSAEFLCYETLIHGFIRYGVLCQAVRHANEEIATKFAAMLKA